jgi:hypothetical protein
MDETIKALMQYINQMQPADGESVLKMLYEYHNEHYTYDNEQIRLDFHTLYQRMNGMPLKEIDKVIDAVCDLCRDHELAGFMEGIKIGIRLAEEVK